MLHGLYCFNAHFTKKKNQIPFDISHRAFLIDIKKKKLGHFLFLGCIRAQYDQNAHTMTMYSNSCE